MWFAWLSIWFGISNTCGGFNGLGHGLGQNRKTGEEAGKL